VHLGVECITSSAADRDPGRCGILQENFKGLVGTRSTEVRLIHRLVRYIDQVRAGINLVLDAGRIPAVGPLLVVIQIDPGEFSLISPLGHISQVTPSSGRPVPVMKR